MGETTENLTLISDYIYLGYMLEMVEHDRAKVEIDRQPLQRTFLAVNDALIDKLHKDLLRVKKGMKDRGIKVVEGEHNDEILNYKYWVKGYENNFGLWRQHAKSELSVRLGKYVAELGNAMREQ